MTKAVIFNEAEIAEQADFTAVGTYARAGDEAICSGAIDYPHHWADLTVSQNTATTIRLNPGSLFVGGTIYQNDTPIDLNLQVHMPVVSADHRYVAILLRGEAETTTSLRMVETDAETGETVQQAVPKTDIRKIVAVVQQGLPSPTPVKPAVAADQCVLCWVDLSSTGIAAIEVEHGSRVKTLYELDGRLSLVEGDVANTIRRTTTLETDVANLAARLKDIPHPTIIRQLKRDAAALRRQMALPDAARAYWYDAGLLPDAWDKTHASWLARIREGIRFSWANERDAQLALVDPASPLVTMSGALMLPAWSEVTRLEVVSDGSSVNISQQVHTVVTAKRREIARTVTEYGPAFTICENNAEWSMSAHRAVGELFTRAGETFEVVEITGNHAWAGHVLRAVRQVSKRTVIDTYWDYVTENIGLNGSIHGQTWLCAQPMVLTSISVSVERVGTSGDLHLLLVECDAGGQPRFDAVIARATKTQAELSVGWVKFDLRPSLVDSGKRYAWVVVTTGNHALRTVMGNKFAQGSRFVCSDGAWSQVITNSDFAFRIGAARFASTRTVVEFSPLTLENGMTEIRLLHGGWEPDGTALIWEVKPSGTDDWQAMTLDNAAGASSLMGLPALTQLRAVMIGTTDLQPAVVMDATARGYTFRPRGDMVAVSDPHDFGLSTTSIQVEAIVDSFDPAKHTVALKVQVGATTYTPTLTVVTPDIINSEKRQILATATVPSTTAARARVEMTTTETTDVPFVQNIAMYAL